MGDAALDVAGDRELLVALDPLALKQPPVHRLAEAPALLRDTLGIEPGRRAGLLGEAPERIVGGMPQEPMGEVIGRAGRRITRTRQPSIFAAEESSESSSIRGCGVSAHQASSSITTPSGRIPQLEAASAGTTSIIAPESTAVTRPVSIRNC